jgi:hypothetical protein
VADVQREQDLLLAPEVPDRLREERVDVRARHGEPLLGPDAGRPEQAPRVRELVVVLLRQRDECRVAFHGFARPPARGARSGNDVGKAIREPIVAIIAHGDRHDPHAPRRCLPRLRHRRGEPVVARTAERRAYSDGWPRTAEEHAQRNAHYSARRDLSDADRLDYNTVVKFGGQTAAERRAVSQEKKRSRDLARVKRTANRDP